METNWTSKRLRLAVVLLILVTGLAAFAVQETIAAKNNDHGRVVLTRDAVPVAGGAAHRDFTLPDPQTAAAASCYGACNCSECVCSGGFSCCLSGCEACWEFLDDGGACNQL